MRYTTLGKEQHMQTIENDYLAVKWTVSRGQDTYGYNICTVRPQSGKAYRCSGGGYDMLGTCVGDWLEDVYQERLVAIRDRAYDASTRDSGRVQSLSPDRLYGMTWNWEKETVTLDGGCGIESILKIADAIGLHLMRTHDRKGHTDGFLVTAKAVA
jgi:hypothetical protein